MSEETCVACGRTNPPGGLTLTEDYDRWVCRYRVQCAQEIARQIREEKNK